MENDFITVQGINDLSSDIETIKGDIVSVEHDIDKTENEIIKMYEELGLVVRTESNDDIADDVNVNVDDAIQKLEYEVKVKKLPKLSNTDIIVSSLSGLIAAIIDFVFIGTPDVVKLYKGGEKFDGSILTGLLRKIGSNKDGKTYEILKWFSEKCIVPYDISVSTGNVTPNNHRLRSFAHDPLIGIIFAIIDIKFGTTTCINNAGKLTILPSKPSSSIEKMLSVIYYVGHLISDVCTARGLPIPGFCLTQFFTGDGSDNSFARKIEKMYYNGYDLRHLASMSTSVMIKDLILSLYCSMTMQSSENYMNMAEREIENINNELKICKMSFIASTVAISGNLIKFIAPPSCGNPCAINLVQYGDFIKNGICMIKACTRNTTPQQIIEQRKNIEDNWKKLENLN